MSKQTIEERIKRQKEFLLQCNKQLLTSTTGWDTVPAPDMLSAEDYSKAKDALIKESRLYTPPVAEVPTNFPDSDWD